jgi:hypothetical protein
MHAPRLPSSWFAFAAIAALSATASPARATPPDTAATTGPFFYDGTEYGSEALIHPLRMIVNGSYGILQVSNRDRRPGAIDHANGIENVWHNVRDPWTAIRRTGTKDFVLRELLPFSTNTRDARYWPNYTQHLIGGGMSYRMIAEWYELHGASHPRAWSVGTMAVYHFWNEVVENDGFVGYTTDPIADLWLFDPLGMVLFDRDDVSRFFSRTLHMADWSYQPSYDPGRRTLENNGQNFALKYKLPWSSTWSLFYYYGTHGEMGLSRAWPGGHAFSFAGGFRAGDLTELGRGVRTVDLVPTFGVFYDRDNSLMASLLLSNTDDYAVRLNLYPGMLGDSILMPGVFVAASKDGRVYAGLTLGALHHIPVGYGMRLAGDDEDLAP